MRQDRRIRYIALTTLLVSLFLSACGSEPTAQPTMSSGAATKGNTVASGTGSKAELVLAIGGESEDGYDPTLGWGSYGSPLFQSTLLKRDANLNLVNDLAEGYTVSKDGLTWTIKLRKDVKFSDGSALTAKDVAYTFNKAAESGGLTDVTVLKEATAPSDYEVVLSLKTPQSTFVNRLVTLGIVPQKLHNADYARKPIGSGPYKMVLWQQGQQLVVEANPLYYGEKPQIQRVIFLFTEEDNAFAQAKAGKVQIAAVPQSLAIQKVDNMKIVNVKSVDNRGLLFPTAADTGKKTAKGDPIGNNVTADPAIRKAVNFVLDRQSLVKGVLEGYGSPAYGPVSGLAWEQTTAAIQDNQVDLAKKILSDAGWKAGTDGILAKNNMRATFTIIHPSSDSIRQALALASADKIKTLGIDVKVEGKSWDDIPKLMHSNIILFGWGSHDQTEMYNLYHSTKATGDYYNAGYYANPAIDNYLDLAMGATSEAEAIAFWKNAQLDQKEVGFTTKGDAVWSWLVNLDHTYFVSNCLDVGKPQIEPHGHGWPITAGIANWKWTCS